MAIAATNIDVSSKYIGGGMRSTPTDLVKMVIALNSGTILNSNTKQEMLKVHYPSASKTQALGWDWLIHKEEPAYYHGGAINGFESYLLHFTRKNISIALMVNQDNYEHTASTTYKVLELFW